MTVKDTFGSLTNFIIVIVVIGALSTQCIFTFIIPPSNWLLWQMMVIVLSTNMTAVILGIYGYRAVEKKQVYLDRNPEFLETIKYISMLSEIMKEHIGEGEEAKEEMREMVSIILTTLSKYLKGKKAKREKERLKKLNLKSDERVYEMIEELR